MSRQEFERQVAAAKEAAERAQARGDEIATKFFTDCVAALEEDWEYEHR